MRSILIVVFLTLVNVQADFIRDDDKDVVKDTVTCLIWQDNADSKTIQKTWQEAIEYCENLSLEDHNDWRLPNIYELYSIGDRSSRYNPAIKSIFKNVVASSLYWSSTTYASDTTNAWVVGFYFGFDSWLLKDTNYYVRCVRLGQ